MTNSTLQRLLLIVIFTVLSFSTVAWSIVDQTPPPWDPADHVNIAYDYYQALAHADFRSFASDFFYAPHYYAPLVHLMTGIVFLAGGASRVTAIIVNLISLALLLGSVDWMTRRLYPEPAHRGRLNYTGLLAALLATCYHFPAWLLHDAFLDYPLTAMVALSMAMLIRAGDFRDSRHAVQFGAVAGLGMLTKQTFPFFLALPVVYAVLLAVRRRELRPMVNLALAGLVCAAVASIWYLPHFEDVRAIYEVNRRAAINENEAPLLSFQSNVYYAFGLISPQMQLPFGLLFVAGVLYSLWRWRRESLMLHLWLISGIAGFTLVANKDMRYTVPVLPAAAIISVCWLPRWERRRPACMEPLSLDSSEMQAGRLCYRRRLAKAATPLLASLVATWAFASFFNAQWPRDGQGDYIDTPRFRFMVFARNYYGMDHAPRSETWGVPEVVKLVSKLGASQHPVESSPPLLGVVVNLPFLNPSTVALHARLLTPVRAGQPLVHVDWLIDEETLGRVAECDYLLVRTGLDTAEWASPAERTVERMIAQNPDRFTWVAAFPIPLKNAEAVLYGINRRR